jgi:hypothetical protein
LGAGAPTRPRPVDRVVAPARSPDRADPSVNTRSGGSGAATLGNDEHTNPQTCTCTMQCARATTHPNFPRSTRSGDGRGHTPSRSHAPEITTTPHHRLRLHVLPGPRRSTTEVTSRVTSGHHAPRMAAGSRPRAVTRHAVDSRPRSRAVAQPAEVSAWSRSRPRSRAVAQPAQASAWSRTRPRSLRGHQTRRRRLARSLRRHLARCRQVAWSFQQALRRPMASGVPTPGGLGGRLDKAAHADRGCASAPRRRQAT